MLHVPPVVLGHPGQQHLANLLAFDMLVYDPARKALRTARASLAHPAHGMPVPVFVQYLDVYLYWLVYVFVFYIRLVPFPA